MVERPSPRDLAKYLAVARQHLSEDKVREFEATYLRLQQRAARWDRAVTPDEDAKEAAVERGLPSKP